MSSLFCNIAVNYAEIPGSTLPFTVAIDLENSVLTPGPGERQKFSYIVTGIGSEDSQMSHLSHWILGLCDEITSEKIVEETVIVLLDQIPQPVVFGENVKIVRSDSETGYSGLKFDFEVGKAGGIMNVCFELIEPHAIGSVPLYLKGSAGLAAGLDICGPICTERNMCESVTYQPATVCVPVTVTPLAVPGATRTICCGAPVIRPGARTCPAGARSCFFTVSQRICVQVPIAFGASTHVGEPQIAYEEACDLF